MPRIGDDAFSLGESDSFLSLACGDEPRALWEALSGEAFWAGEAVDSERFGDTALAALAALPLRRGVEELSAYNSSDFCESPSASENSLMEAL